MNNELSVAVLRHCLVYIIQMECMMHIT